VNPTPDQCIECDSSTNELCPICENPVCEECYDDHLDEYHGTGGDDF
jgi:hypothetical protein